MKPKLKAWIVFPGGTKFGEGRARLLRLVEEEGSLRGAVKRMGMSYRAAWGYMRELERAAGHPFLERAGPGPGAGTRLTAEARALLAGFERFHGKLDASASRAFRAAFARRRDA
jgi:molybdate transport system regulatory protein